MQRSDGPAAQQGEADTHARNETETDLAWSAGEAAMEGMSKSEIEGTSSKAKDESLVGE